MTVVTLEQAEADFEHLVAEVEAGGKVTITVDGKPVASLVPYAPRPVSRAQAAAGLAGAPEG